MKILPLLLGVLSSVFVFVSSLHSADQPQVVPLWTGGAPGFESRRNEPELARDYWVRNIQNPSLTVFLPPKEKATGVSVVICPGGGHRELVFNSEGVEAAQYFRSMGIAAFVLKYRLAREEGSPYSIEKHAAQDGLRAVRLVRSRARELNLDPMRIGIVGFSAGGEVAAMVSYGQNSANPAAPDPIDRMSARPDFAIFIYPGPIGFPQSVTSEAPPAFFVASTNDARPATTITEMLQRYREAKVPVEVHLYSHGAHAFNMGYRSEFQSIRGWPQRVSDWIFDSGFLFSGAIPAPGSG